MAELAKFKRRLIRSVARMLRQDKTPDDEAWQQLKKETGCDCKLLWERMKALTIKKIRRLLKADDRTENVAPVARMSVTDWLLFDLVLVHEKLDVIGRDLKFKDKETAPALEDLLRLVMSHEIEEKSRALARAVADNRPASKHHAALVHAWAALTHEYNSEGGSTSEDKGRAVSPMLLQRRWYQLKEATRSNFYHLWHFYRGNDFRWDAAAVKPSLFQANIASVFGHVLTEPFLEWEEMIEQGLVILPEVFDMQRRNKESAEEDKSGLILIEPNIETIDLEAESEDETSRNSTESKTIEEQNPELKKALLADVTKVKQEPEEDGLSNVQILETMHIPTQSPTKATVSNFLDREAEKQRLVSEIANCVEDVHNSNANEIEMINESPGSSIEVDDNVDIPDDLIKQKADEFCSKKAEVTTTTPKKELEIDNIPEEDEMDDIIKKKADDFVRQADVKKLLSEFESEMGEQAAKSDAAVKVEASATVEDDDGIEIVDDGIEYFDDEDEGEYAAEMPPDFQSKDQAENIKIDVKEEKEEAKDTETKADDEANSAKFDLKLLMNPVVYTTKLDDMIIFKDKKFDSIKLLELINSVIVESRPVSDKALPESNEKEKVAVADSLQNIDTNDSNDGTPSERSDANSSDEDEISEDLKVKPSSYLLQKPRSREYNPIQLCKNPDFNTRLKRLTVGFFSYPSNREFLKECKPMTIDLHKAFESKLVNGTLYLKKSTLQSPEKKMSAARGESAMTSSVVPSAMPARSLFHAPAAALGPRPRLDTVDLTRPKVINLRDISEIRRINQQLLTAQVPPMRVFCGPKSRCPQTIEIEDDQADKQDRTEKNDAAGNNDDKPSQFTGSPIDDRQVSEVRGSGVGMNVQSDSSVNDVVAQSGSGVNEVNIPSGSRINEVNPQSSNALNEANVQNSNQVSDANTQSSKEINVLSGSGSNEYRYEDYSYRGRGRGRGRGGAGATRGAGASRGAGAGQGGYYPSFVPRFKTNTLSWRSRIPVPETKLDEFLLQQDTVRKMLMKIVGDESGFSLMKPIPKSKAQKGTKSRESRAPSADEQIDVEAPPAPARPPSPPPAPPRPPSPPAPSPTKPAPKPVQKPRRRRTKFCCWANEQLMKLRNNQRSNRWHRCGRICTCCCRQPLGEFMKERAAAVVGSDDEAETGRAVEALEASAPRPRLRVFAEAAAERFASPAATSVPPPAPSEERPLRVFAGAAAAKVTTPTVPSVPPPASVPPASAPPEPKPVLKINVSFVPPVTPLVPPPEATVPPNQITLFPEDLPIKRYYKKIRPVIPLAPAPTIRTAKRAIVIDASNKSLASPKPSFHLGKNKILLTDVKFPADFPRSFSSMNSSLMSSMEPPVPKVVPEMSLPAGVQLTLLPSGKLTYTVDPGVTLTPEEEALMPSILTAVQQQIDSSEMVNTAGSTSSVKVSSIQSVGVQEPHQTPVGNPTDSVTQEEGQPHVVPITDLTQTPDESAAPSLSELPGSSRSSNASEIITFEETSQTASETVNTANKEAQQENNSISNEGTVPIVENDTNDNPAEEKSNVTSKVSQDEKNENLDTNKEAAGSRNLLSDLMEMSGISAEDTKLQEITSQEPNGAGIGSASTQTHSVANSVMPAVIDVEDTSLQQLTVSAAPQVSQIHMTPSSLPAGNEPSITELTPIGSLAELKYACENNGQFFKLDFETGLIARINVCIKKNVKARNAASLEPKAVIDLTDEFEEESNTEALPRNVLKSGPKQDKVAIKPVKMFRSNYTLTSGIIGKKRNLIRFGIGKEFIKRGPRSRKQSLLKPDININLVDSDTPMEEEYLLESDSDTETRKRTRDAMLATETIEDSDDSSDNEPLAKKVSKMRGPNDHPQTLPQASVATTAAADTESNKITQPTDPSVPTEPNEGLNTALNTVHSGSETVGEIIKTQQAIASEASASKEASTTKECQDENIEECQDENIEDMNDSLPEDADMDSSQLFQFIEDNESQEEDCILGV